MPSTVTTASSMKSGAVRISQPGRPRVVLPHEEDEHGKPDDEVDERHAAPPPSGSSVRGKYTFVTSGRFASRLRLARLRAEAKYCIGRTPATTRLGYGVPPDGKFANLPKTIDVDERRERRDEDRPGDAEERLLVADGDVAPDERPEELAVVPELADVEPREPARRPDHRHAAWRHRGRSRRRRRGSERRSTASDGVRRSFAPLRAASRFDSPRDASAGSGPSRAQARRSRSSAATSPGCSSVSASAGERRDAARRGPVGAVQDERVGRLPLDGDDPEARHRPRRAHGRRRRGCRAEYPPSVARPMAAISWTRAPSAAGLARRPGRYGRQSVRLMYGVTTIARGPSGRRKRLGRASPVGAAVRACRGRGQRDGRAERRTARSRPRCPSRPAAYPAPTQTAAGTTAAIAFRAMR